MSPAAPLERDRERRSSDDYRDLLALVAFGLSFFVTHQVGLRTITSVSPLSPVWPPSGVALAAFVLLPRRTFRWAVAIIVLAEIASNYLAGVRMTVGLLYLAPSLLELAVSLWVLDRIAGRALTFRRIRDTFAILLAAGVGAGVSGLLAGLITIRTASATYTHSVGVWWTADVLGIILVTPLVISWARGAPLARIPWTRAAEGVLFLLFWTWSATEIFHGHFVIGWLRPHPYMLASLMVWASFRLGIRGVTAAMSSVAVVAVSVVLRGGGAIPLGGENIAEQLFLVQVFLAVIGVTGLLLASALAEARAATEAARETADSLRALGDHLPNGIVAQLVTEADGSARFVHVSAGVEQVLGRRADEILADSQLVFEQVVEEDRARFIEAEREARQALRVLSTETRIRRLDGEERWLYFSATSRRLDDGRVVSDGIALDVTDRRRGEDQLRRANRALRTISSCNQVLVRARSEDELLREVCTVLVTEGGFRLAWVGYAESDGEQRVVPVAHAGYEDGYLEGLDIRWSDTPHGRGPTGTTVRTGQPVVCHDFLTDPAVAPWRDDAIARGYRASAVLPLRNTDGVFGALSVYAPDADAFDPEELALLTELADDLAFGIAALRGREERVRAETALAASEERFRQLAENIREIFWMLDARTGGTLYMSPGVERLFGVSAETLVRNPDAGLQLIHPDDRQRVIDSFARVAAGGEQDEQYRIVHPSGAIRWVHARAFPVRDASGAIYRVVGVSDDITERRRIEEQLRQVQKLEAIGQLAGGIAHDFNNILAAIMMQAGTARALPGVSGDLAELLQDVEASAQRAANLTRQLLLFSRKSVMQARQVEVNDLIAGLARMLRRIVPESHRLQLSLHPRALTVNADPGMVEQVVVNLTVNARDAMPSGGDLAIETFERSLYDDDVRPFPGVAPGLFAGIRVRDSGTGIAPDVRPHIFEPFFTTKEPGKGTGLGLATVFGIMQQHRGVIAVESAVGSGTAIEVLFPAVSTNTALPSNGTVSRSTTVAAVVQHPPASAPDEQPVILVVEDDAMLRAVIQRVLAQHGFVVHTARTGREALQQWDRYTPRVDLLLTDMVMPDGVGGAELAATLLAREPGLRVVYSSGYDPDYGEYSVRLEPGVNFLQKPATPRQIVDIVNRRLQEA